MNRKLHPDSLVVRLLDDGLVTPSQVELAETEQRRRGGSVAKVLCDLGFVAAEQFTEVLAREAGIPLADPSSLRPGPDVAGLIPVETARRLKLLPLGRRDGTLVVAMADPCDVVALDHLRRCVATEVEILAAPERAILNALDASERAEPGIQKAITRWLAEEAPGPETAKIELGVAAPGTDSAPVVQLVQEILVRATEMGASDVHFEPAEQWLRVRVRVDGLLFPDVLIPKPLQSAVAARLKVLGDLDVAETRVPQDGRTTLTAHRQQYNLRISSLPTQYGESLVVRLLPAESAVPSLGQLGFDATVADRLRRAASNPNGVIIVTGPTGSGKTTTLYALLNELNRPDTGVFTLEDPVEMPVGGIRQTQIHEEAGLTYAVALRALLRQDPDVILVGETRDTETAQLMVRAAMTGHLVLTTLHTNDAIGAIPRLIDLGVERCLLSGSLVAVLAQRLVRCLCRDCRQPVPDPARGYAEQGISIPATSEPRLWRAMGCASCRNSGYRGRRALFELLMFEERLHTLVARNAAPTDLVNAARSSGMRTLFEDGLRHTMEGTTTLEDFGRQLDSRVTAMHTFLFNGIDRQGRAQSGQLGAVDEAELEARLRNRGVWLLDARKTREPANRSRRRHGASRRTLTQFCTLMTFQTRVGIPLTTALETAAQDGESRAFAGLVGELKRRVESGESLADALETYPRVFGANFVQLIRAGERSGSLPEAFLQLKSHLEWQERVTSEVKQATIYPLVVLLATIVFIGILFTFVVPKFVGLLAAVKVPLPGPTRLVFAASRFARNDAGKLVVGMGLGLGMLAWARRRSASVARQLDRTRLTMPIVGPLVRLLVLTRFAHNLALLYRNGVSLPSALELVGRVVGSSIVAEAVNEVRGRVLQGTTLSDAMRRHAMFPGLLIRLTVVGERTGQLDEALEQVASYYNELLPRRVKQLLSLLEPALILGLVGIVGFVALAVILPVLSLMQSLR